MTIQNRKNLVHGKSIHADLQQKCLTNMDMGEKVWEKEAME